MDTAVIKELAAPMTRMYGKRQAFEWDDRYATEATANGDSIMHQRWAAVAALLGEAIEMDERNGHIGRS